jgi:apolipoprotein N-acyltransferase
MKKSLHEKTMSLDALFCGASGILLALSFPKTEISWFAFIALVPLLYTLWRPERRISSFSCGLITGLTFYLGTINWLTLTMENYGGVPRWLSLLILVIFSVYLAFYMALFSWGVVRLKRSPVPIVLTAPVLWVALEYGRGHLLTGFPWALLGYSQYTNLLLIQVSDIVGVYGVSFIVVLVNTVLFKSAHYVKHFKSKGGPPATRGLLIALTSAISCLLLTLAYGAYRVEQFGRTHSEKSIKVGVVQGNIEQNQKWDPAFRDKILAVHARLTRLVAIAGTDLIIWPEASVPFYFMADREYQSRLLRLIDDIGIDLLFGSPDYRVEEEKRNYYNSTFLVSPGAKLKGSYDKMHLVPFGEYVPLRRALFFVRPIIEQIGDMTPGREVTLMKTDNWTCGTPICYEIILPDLVRRFVLKGADFIATLTNDDWFGHSSAPYQHFSMAVFRAVENRVSVVRAANSGISGVIAPDGRIVKKTEIFVEDAFTETFPVYKRTTTFYTRYGDVFARCCIAAALLMVGGSYFTRGESS